MRKIVLFITSVVFFGHLATPAYGNPVVAYFPNPVTVSVGFCDVVLIEAIVLAWITQRTFMVCLGASALANFVSTIPGLFLFAGTLEFLGPGAGYMVLLLEVGFSFLISIFLEYLVLRILWRESPRQAIVRATLAANIVSYLLIASLIVFACQGLISIY